jgi:hypothetical protein
MATYDNETLDRIPPNLQPREKEHVLVVQDETVFHTNEYCRRSWLAQDQQPIQKKGGGWAIHVSDFISETVGRIKLTPELILDQLQLPQDLCLPEFEARKIIYPGKGFDDWWSLKQLIKQIEITISIFQITHPNCVGVFVFDRSSTHEGFAEDALNVNHMNIKPGGKQKVLRDMVIPLGNLAPAPGKEDTCGKIQYMCYPDDYSDLILRGKLKGIQAILMECKSIWEKFMDVCMQHNVSKPVGKCASCNKSQLRKDAERWVALAEQLEDNPSARDTKLLEAKVPIAEDGWCCMNRVLSLQDDFRTEKPQLQSIIEKAGHICLFLPRFHCELNAIEMLWGYVKYCVCLLYVSHVDRSLASLIIQVIGIWLMANLTQPEPLYQGVWMSVLSLQSAASSKNPGDILTRTGMCFTIVYVIA